MSQDTQRREREFSKELWVTIMFAAVVSEAVPYRQILESWKLRSIFATFVWERWSLPLPGWLIFLFALFPVIEALVLLVALSAYLVVTRSFSLRGFLKGLLVAVLVLPLYFVVMFLSSGLSLLEDLSLSYLFFYYVVWRLPLFFGLVVAVWIARPDTAHPHILGPKEPPTTPEEDARDIDQLLDSLLLLSTRLPQTHQPITDLRRKSKTP